MSKKPSKLHERINLALTIVTLVLFLTVPPLMCGLLYLSRVPDITWGEDGDLAYTRIWMYRERRPVGIGYQSRHVIAQFTDAEVCVETRLRFFLWGKSRLAEPASTTQKMVFDDNRWQPTGENCQ